MFSSRINPFPKFFKNYRIQCRKNSVRVRFAPSPTGFLHLGGLRTALYNHLFALSKNGTTVLRIEDTDRERIVPGAVDQLVDDLKWCGLEYHEGPFLQSERLSLYRTRLKRLLETGHAYKCFCTSTRMDILRREAVKTGQVPRYDNRCRSLTDEEISHKLEGNVPYCVRFKLDACSDPVNDLIYGEVSQDVANLEGDPVIVKTDGYPTYHFANVVDDHEMGITHVLRGVEWLGSTQKHLLLYRAFGWQAPKFAHLPLLLNPDGTKLSKRQGVVDVRHYRKQGVFPLAVVNFVVRAGGGFDVEQWERDAKSFTMYELIDKFDLEKVNGSSTKVSLDKLSVSNQLELMRKLGNETELKELVVRLQDLVKTTLFNGEYELELSDTYVRHVLKWTKNRISYLEDLVTPAWRFLWVLPAVSENSPEEIVAINFLLGNLNKCAFEHEELKKLCKGAADVSGLKFSAVMTMLRRILSGFKEGPSVVEMMTILGKPTVLQRLQSAIPKNTSHQLNIP